MTNKDVPRVLRAAAKLVRNGWTREAFARNSTNMVTSIDSLDACKFCSTGAILRAAIDLKLIEPTIVVAGGYTYPVAPAIEALCLALSETMITASSFAVRSVEIWNDRKAKTGKEVASMMEAAAAKFESLGHAK